MYIYKSTLEAVGGMFVLPLDKKQRRFLFSSSSRRESEEAYLSKGANSLHN